MNLITNFNINDFNLRRVLLCFFTCLISFYSSSAFSAISTVASEQSGTTVGIIEHVGAGTAASRNNNCGSITPTVPAGNVGDLLIAVAVIRENTTNVTMPGWTLYYSEYHGVDGNQDVGGYIFYRVATGGDPSTITSTSTGAPGNCRSLRGQISRFDGVDVSAMPGSAFEPNPIAAGNSSTQNTANVTTGTNTTTVATAMSIAVTFINDNATVTEADGFSESFDFTSTGGRDSSMSLNFRQEGATGSKGAFTWPQNLGTDESVGVLFALKPDNTLEGVSINVPAGTTTDDVMLAAIAVGPSTTGITAPAGWTLINRQDQGVATSNSQALYYRVATSTEPTAYTWTFSGGAINGTAAGIITYRGVDTTSVVDVSGSQATASSTNHASTSVVTTVPNTIVVTAHSYSSSDSWTEPALMTEQVDIASAGTPLADGISLGMFEVAQAVAGATGVKTATAAGNADTGVVQIVALTPTVISSGITVNFSVAPRRILAGSISLTNAALGTPETSATNTNPGDSASITTNITTIANNALLIDVVGKARGNQTYSQPVDQTERWDNELGGVGGGATGAMSTKSVATAGLTSMMQTNTNATRPNAHAVVSIAPVNSGSTTTFDAVASATGNNAASVNWTHTFTTSSTVNTKLIVGVTYRANAACGGTSITSVTLGGLNFTQIAATSIDDIPSTTCQYSELWYVDLNNIILSTNNNSNLGGQGIDQDEAVEYDVINDTGSLFLDDATFSANERLTGLHLYSNGNVALATATDANIGGNAFQDDDIVEVTPSGTAGVYDFVQVIFDGGTHFTAADERIDAVYVRNNGNIILSTIGPAQLPLCGGGNLNFIDDDLVEWDPTNTCATMFLDESATTNLIPNAGGDEDIVGVHLLNDDDDLILFSLVSNNTIRGTAVLDGDVILYDRANDTATVYFSEANFTANEDIDALTLAREIILDQIDHYDIDFSSATGITCLPVDVTITAKDNTDTTVSHTSDTTIDFNVSTNLGQWATTPSSGTGDITDPTPGTPDNGDLQYEFPSGESSVTIALSYTEFAVPGNSETFEIDITTTPDEDGGIANADDDPTVTFEFTAIIFNNVTDTNNTITTQISGKPSDTGFNSKTYNLQVLNADEDDPSVCQSIFGNGDVVSIELGAECKNPDTCAGNEMNIDNINPALPAAGVDIDTSDDDSGASTVASYEAVDLEFGLNAAAEIVLTYPDAGSMELHARYELLLDDGVTGSGEYASGISNSFVVRPFGFDVQVSGNPAAIGPGGTRFTGAGEDFTVTARAVGWNSAGDSNNDGIPDNHDDNDPSNNTDLSSTVTYPTTPNFGQEGTNEATDEDIDLSAVLDQPSPGVDPGLSGGTLITTIASGSGNSTTVNYNEVGIIEIEAQVAVDNDYLGVGSFIGKSGYVGRFSPYVFEATPNTPEFGPACGTFSYIGQSFTYTTAPVINLTARARGVAPAFGNITQNYTGVFFRLTDSKLSTDGNKMYDAATGTLDTSLVPSPDPVIADTGSGTATFTFSDGGGIAFVRGNPEDPFDADIALSINVLDEDDVFAGNGSFVNQNPVSFGTATAGNGIAFTGANKDQRWGRLVLDNAFGSELLPLEIPVRTEYQSGGNFITNTDDSCTPYTSGNITFSNHNGITVGANLTASGAGTLMSGVDDDVNPLTISNSLLEVGSVDVTHTIDFWLQYDWDNNTNHDNNPTSRATWGIFAGPDEFIYIREPW